MLDRKDLITLINYINQHKDEIPEDVRVHLIQSVHDLVQAAYEQGKRDSDG